MEIDSYIIPTYKCNLNCKFCFAGDFINTQNDKQWTDEDFYLFFEEAFNNNALYNITIGGGEPLIFPKFISRVIKYIQGHNIINNVERVNVVTNGTLLSQIQNIEDAQKFLTLNLSLHGFEQSHELLVGKTGIWKNIIRNTYEFCKKGYKFDIGIVVNKVNIKEVPKLIDFLISLGFSQFHVIFYHYIGSAVKNKKLLFVDFFGDDKVAVEHISEYILSKKNSRVTINIVNNFPYCQLGGGGTFEKQQSLSQMKYFFKIKKGYYSKTYKDIDVSDDFFDVNVDDYYIGDFEALTTEIIQKTKFLDICNTCSDKRRCNLVLDYIDSVFYQKVYNLPTQVSNYFLEKIDI